MLLVSMWVAALSASLVVVAGRVENIEAGRAMIARDASTVFAKRVQCPGCAVAMPCPNRSYARVFHLHVAKMGGRSLMAEGPEISGRPACRWYSELVDRGEAAPFPRYVFWGEDERFRSLAARHGGEAACFASRPTGPKPWSALAPGESRRGEGRGASSARSRRQQ